MLVRLLATALVAACTAGVVEAQPKPKTLDVPLVWTPKEAPAMPVVDLTGGVRPFTITPFADARDNRSAIGENTEKKPPVTVVTSSDVPKFVSDNLSRELKQLGLDVSGTDPDRVLSGELLQFWVRDTGSYDATLRVKLTMRDRAGTELWTGVATGRGENWGRQLKPINYTEAIATAVLDLVANLVKTPEFMKTLKKSGL